MADAPNAGSRPGRHHSEPMNADITPYWPVLGTLLFSLLTARLILKFWRLPKTVPERLLAIDGLRGYLALGVFLAHGSTWYVYMRSAEWKSPDSHLYAHLSTTSVSMFFMITAFLFWQKLLEQDKTPIRWNHLFISRAFRLVPLYVACVALLLFMAFYATDFQLNESWLTTSWRIAHWLAFTIPGTQAINGLGDTVLLMVGAWSLPYEWMFYAALPMASWLLRRPTPSTWIAAATIATLMIVLSMPRFDPIHLGSFAVGIIAACIYRAESIRSHLASNRLWGGIALILTGVTVYVFPTIYSLPPLLVMGVVFTIIACGNPIYGILTNPVSRLLGEISYSIYLLHGFWLYGVFEFVIRRIFTGLTPTQHWQIILIIAPLLVLTSFASYRLIEAPGIALGKRFRR